MTCNQFLACFGEPSAVEARLGRVYLNEGLSAAFEWIERNLMPVFERQQAKRAAPRRGSARASHRLRE
jgi:dsRNA-specific ribonuclease